MYRSSNFQPNNTLSITPQWNNLICYLCKQPGHIKRNCPNSFSIPTINSKFRQIILKVIRKSIAKKLKDPIIVEEKNEDIELNYASRSKKRVTALYYDAYIKNVKIPLIIDSGFARCIISLKLLKDLDMEITGASETIMTHDSF
ncbi:19056_t:CDS:2 [Funneliformis geosporum]|uniref:19056_t:CDS:1 n=1 Tax=Funneliformis geosporum TaxID=1117311 RepID=A0A9W4WTI3_9GLOM|nr:19056_t:CDS:2 [Funneliformis geosporum]